MILVDTHVHVSQHWYEPVEALLFHMDRDRVAKAVLTQFWGNYDNRYELDCIRTYPGRFAAVVIVDIQRADAPDTLERWAKEGAVGVRLRVDWRSPAPDPLPVWRRASELGLVVSAGGKADMFAADEFRRLVEWLPDLKIILEHLGGRPEPQTDCLEKVLALAEYPNVFIKLPGLGELSPRPKPFPGVPFSEPPSVVRSFYNAFGRERLMWASDFPTCSHREGYTNALRLPIEKTPFFGTEDKEWIFGKTALSLFKFQE